MNNAPTETFDTLAGGKQVTVKLTNGNQETVFVKQLPIRKLPDYLAKQDDEAGLIELATGKPAEWIDGLTIKSHEALIETVEAMNHVPFFAWLRRKVRRAEQLAPGSTGEQGKAMLSASSDGSLSARSAVD